RLVKLGGGDEPFLNRQFPEAEVELRLALLRRIHLGSFYPIVDVFRLSLSPIRGTLCGGTGGCHLPIHRPGTTWEPIRIFSSEESRSTASTARRRISTSASPSRRTAAITCRSVRSSGAKATSPRISTPRSSRSSGAI